jgi:hypothetical protein
MPLSSEKGITVVELLVAITAGLAVLMGSFAMLNGTLRGSARTQQRVDANQRGRPVMTRIMDELHSVCVAPNVAPIYPGSGDNSITFLHKTGSEVAPVPDRRTISLASGTLSETASTSTQGTYPNYTFSGSTTRMLLTNVGPGQLNGATVPLFRYYDYASGGVSTTPLPTPLSATNAAKTVVVEVTFSVAPNTTQVVEPNAAVTLTDSALFRYTPGAEDIAATNLPCQ